MTTASRSDSSARLRMEGVRKRFGATVALDGVGLSIQAGEVLALIGENGAGKSTWMKILSGAIKPDDGKIWLDGEPYFPHNPHNARLAGVCMIYQELSLVPHLSVAENILLGMEPDRAGFVRRKEIRNRATQALDRLGHPEIDPDLRVDRLSVANRQVVEMARAVAVGCRVLVLDEPTSSLTSEDVERLFVLVARLACQGTSVVYISHNLDEVRRVSDRFIVLRDGKTVGEGRTADVSTSALITMMVGREVIDLYPRSRRSAGEPVLEVEGLAGKSRPQTASLVLHRGEVFGIAGLIDAGRTELLRILFGLDPVRKGRIRFKAWIGPASPARRWAQGMGMTSENRKEEGLAMGLSVADNLMFPRLGGRGRRGLVQPRRLLELASRWIDDFGIRVADPRDPVQSLSGGNQQKVALARLLAQDVDVLLLDEPTRGIDVGSKAQIYRKIDDLALQGKAVLMVSSYLPELLGLCDRVAVMCRGRLGPAHPVDTVDEKNLMNEMSNACSHES